MDYEREAARMAERRAAEAADRRERFPARLIEAVNAMYGPPRAAAGDGWADQFAEKMVRALVRASPGRPAGIDMDEQARLKREWEALADGMERMYGHLRHRPV